MTESNGKIPNDLSAEEVAFKSLGRVAQEEWLTYSNDIRWAIQARMEQLGVSAWRLEKEIRCKMSRGEIKDMLAGRRSCRIELLELIFDVLGLCVLPQPIPITSLSVTERKRKLLP